MESIIRDTIMKHLNEEKLINQQQHGFVPKKSCVTNLLETFDLITEAMENGNSVDIAFLDFAKAFDSVPHNRLCLKVKAYGIKFKLLEWIRGFLSNREQRVVLGNYISDWDKVISGVPQGSVLGPLLFVIYINDITEELENQAKLYADDTKVISIQEHNIPNLSMQRDLDRLTNWSEKWLLKFNTSKCKIMHIGKKNSEQKYYINIIKDNKNIQQELIETREERDLGIIVSQNLKWNSQVNSAVSKANKKLGMIKHCFKYFNEKSTKSLYTSLVRPYLEYANSVWNPYLVKDIKKVEMIQHRATKTYCTRNLRYEERLTKLRLTTLEKRRERGDLIQLFKIIKNIDVVNWYHPLEFIVDDRSRRQNRSLRLRRELSKMTIRHEFFTNRVINKWNELSQVAISAENINDFKRELDRSLYLS